uniref:Uncharacterized protein n=1 Tax=Utricularia reniformis TaxID=192314 RepID=A0A1Y0B1R5_9LAMI|nr:hypothetical protein AEK19_MT1145 [Utricularia reniformis]ART31360.1 hypothetical protein AEK19_MT1145 [Utricularia reniformis]
MSGVYDMVVRISRFHKASLYAHFILLSLNQSPSRDDVR